MGGGGLLRVTLDTDLGRVFLGFGSTSGRCGVRPPDRPLSS